MKTNSQLLQNLNKDWFDMTFNIDAVIGKEEIEYNCENSDLSTERNLLDNQGDEVDRSEADPEQVVAGDHEPVTARSPSITRTTGRNSSQTVKRKANDEIGANQDQDTEGKGPAPKKRKDDTDDGTMTKLDQPVASTPKKLVNTPIQQKAPDVKSPAPRSSPKTKSPSLNKLKRKTPTVNAKNKTISTPMFKKCWVAGRIRKLDGKISTARRCTSCGAFVRQKKDQGEESIRCNGSGCKNRINVNTEM